MPDPLHHPDCPRCKGEGFYLRREGRGYMRDGSFEHNDWQDCDCTPYTKFLSPISPLGERENINEGTQGSSNG